MKTRCLRAIALLVIFVPGSAFADWNSTIGASNPLNWYQFNELAGSTAVDHGTQHLNGAYGTGALDATRGVTGLVGTAAQFGDQSTVFLGASDITGNWSAEFVLRRVGSKRSSVLIRGIPFAFPSQALKLEQFDSTEQIGFTQYGAGDFTFSPAVPTPLNQWIDIVYVRSAPGMTLYVNGVLAGSSTANIDLPRDQIGSWSDTIPESPLAIMDEVVLYNRALSPTEIAAHFAAVPEPSTFVLATGMLFGLCMLAAVSRYRSVSIRVRSSESGGSQ